MKFINPFDKYFLMLMIYWTFILYFVDSKSFLQINDRNAYKQGRLIASILFFISVILFIIKKAI